MKSSFSISAVLLRMRMEMKAPTFHFHMDLKGIMIFYGCEQDINVVWDILSPRAGIFN